MSTRSPAVLFPAPQDETTAAVVAVCGPNREVVTYLMAVRTPDMATFYVVANLVEFTAQERAQTLRRLGRELVSRCLGRPRVFVGRAGMSLSQARNTLGELDLQVEHGHPSAMRVDSADPVGAVLRPGTVVLPSRPGESLSVVAIPAVPGSSWLGLVACAGGVGIVGSVFVDQDSQGVSPRCPRTSLPCPC